MMEWKRTIFSGRFPCLLLCVILLNGIFFLKVQFDRSLGLDLSGPESQLSHSVVVTEEGISQSEELPQIPLNELNKEYITVLDELKSLSLQEIVSTLTERMERLSLLWDGCILYMRQRDSDFDRAQWEDYAKQHLEVSENIIDGSTTQEDVYREYVAVHTLFLRSESLMNFPEYLQSIEKNKDYMLTFPIFRDENSFSSRNILKTADDFQSLQNVPLSLENTGAIEGILLYSGSDLFLILLLIVVALCFLAERKRELWGLVYSLQMGRSSLALHRLGILLFLSVTGTLLLYGSNVLLGSILYGGIGNLHISVQSIPILQEYPVPISIGGFLIQYIVLRIGSAFLLGLILWLLLGALSDARYGVVIGIAFLLIEYGLHHFLPEQSAYNILKYLNLCTYFHIAPLYTHYLNVDILGFPVGIRRVSELAALPLIFVMSSGCIAQQCFRRPAQGTSWIDIFTRRLGNCLDRCLKHLPLWGREVYKILFSQRGIVILLLFVYLALGIEHSVPLRSGSEQVAYERQYLVQLQGEITSKTFSEIDRLQEEQKKTIETMEQAKEAYSNGEIPRGEYMSISFEGNIAQIKLAALDEVESRAETLKQQSEIQGFTPFLLDETPYQSVYGEPAKIVRLKSLLLILGALLLLLGANSAYERKSKMIPLLRSAKKGRKGVLCEKVLAAVCITLLLWAVMYGKEFWDFYRIFPQELWNIAPQNLSILSRFPVSCTLTQFFIMYYLAGGFCTMITSILLILSGIYLYNRK